MIDLLKEPPETLPMSKRYILEEVISRGGWKAYLYREDSPLMRLVRPDGKVIELHGTAPPNVSYSAGTRVDDKYATYLLLKENSIQTPETYLCTKFDDALDKLKLLLISTKNAVVKPLDSSHGNGVTVLVNSEETLREAWVEAQKFSDHIILQKQVDEAYDIRFTIIANKLAGAVVRTPASVVADGVHTIEELIVQENMSEQRGFNYTRPKNVIDTQRAQAFLGDKYRKVPQNPKRIQVIGTANLGTGGELQDITHLLPGWLVGLAEKVSLICDLSVCGVDIITNRSVSPTSTTQDLELYVIEVNKAPSIFLNDILSSDGSRPTTKAYVDYLETL